MSSNIRITKTCTFCEKEFVAKTTKTRYCSHSCNQKDYKRKQRVAKIQRAEELEITKKVDVSHLEMISKREFLNIGEAAELLGVSESTFYRLMRNGTIKKNKLGGRTIIKRSDLDNLFQ